MRKDERWYEIKDGLLYVYGGPIPGNAPFVSIVQLSDISYYRTNFRLRKVWSQ